MISGLTEELVVRSVADLLLVLPPAANCQVTAKRLAMRHLSNLLADTTRPGADDLATATKQQFCRSAR